MEIELNWIAVILAALSSMVVGSVWYGPLFGKRWAKLAKVKLSPEIGTAEAISIYVGAFLVSLITAIVLAMSIFVAYQFFGGSYLWISVVTATVLWLGFTAARVQLHDSFEGRPKQLTSLTLAHEWVTFVVMAVIIGVWPA
jgi:hypothetical protein